MTGQDIKAGSISASNLAPGTIRPGELQVIRVQSATDTSDYKTVQADCPKGWQIIGGGAHTVIEENDVHGSDGPVAIRTSTPSANGWWSRAGEMGGMFGRSWRLFAEAICIKQAL